MGYAILSPLEGEVEAVEVDTLSQNMKNMTASAKGRATFVINVYKKSILNYKKELKNIDAIINENLKLN